MLPDDINELNKYNSSHIVSSDGMELNQTEKQLWIDKNKISDHFFHALIATEDHRFYSHSGVVLTGMIKALIIDVFIYLNIKDGPYRGGSTLTQQLAKNLFLTPEQTINRKIIELLTALHLERKYTKDEILTAYANLVDYGTDWVGRSIFGIEQASRVYFNKSAMELTVNEAALLTGILKSSSYYSPYRHPQRANYRRKIVLSRMKTVGYIDSAQYEQFYSEDIALNKNNQTKIPQSSQYYLDFIKQGFLKQFPYELFYSGGLTIHTTLDGRLQGLLEEAVKKNMEKLDARLGFKTKFDSASYEDKKKYPQAAALVVSIPTGEIKAMIGGRDYYQSQFNRVIYSPRQMGSCFKPFNYLLAFQEKKITTFTKLKDQLTIFINNREKWRTQEHFNEEIEKLQLPRINNIKIFNDVDSLNTFYMNIYSTYSQADFISDEKQKAVKTLFNYGHLDYWKPKNFSRSYRGEILLGEALANSVNTISAQILERYDMEKLCRLAHSIGFKNIPENSLSLSLGTLDGTVYQVAGGYLMLANNGYFTIPYGINSIMDAEGNIIYRPHRFQKKIVNGYAVKKIRQLMEEVIQSGTGRMIPRSGYTQKIAGKTGTASNNTDAWFCGFTPNLLCIVWVGYDESKPLKTVTGGEITGGAAALPIWLEFMRNAVPNNISLEFLEPDPKDFYLFYEDNIKQVQDKIYHLFRNR